MNIKVQRIIFVILTIVTFVAIFVFSGQNGEESGSLSREVTRIIIEMLQLDRNLNEVEKEEFIENSQFAVRKLAHFSIYTVVGINVFGFINTFDLKTGKKILFTLIVGIFYAISDEFYQMFSGGRTPAVGDVFIDSCGGLFGIFVFMVLDRIIFGKKGNM